MVKIAFSDLVEINPKVKLNKDDEYPFVEMGEVEPSRRYVYGLQDRPFSGGGTRFKSGDVLFARITPCLENGKIAQFDSDRQVGFGSTEFFVYRALPGISNPGYIYYLSKSDLIRQPAIKSMSGASGRQRADLESIINIAVPYHPLPAQNKIATILSAYDDLIENNLRRIKILEEMAQNLYREWFVNFRFPGHEKARFVDSPLGKIPEGWEIEYLKDISIIIMGQSPKSEFYNSVGAGLPFHQGVANFGRRFPLTKYYCTIEKRIANKGDILFSVRAPVGRINIADRNIIIGRGLSAIRHNSGWQWFLYHLLRYTFHEEDTIGGGTIFKSVTKSDMENIKILDPQKNMIEKFEALVLPMEEQIEVLEKKNINLRQTRDLLLPKLMPKRRSGKKANLNRWPEGAG